MDNTPTNKANRIAQKFWAKTRELWSSLSVAGKKKWLAKAIEVTQNAWAVATMGTDLKCPLKYSDFATVIKADTNLDGIIDEDTVVHSPAMYYAHLDRKCKNTWDAVAVKQVLKQLCDQYALRDEGI
jgi:hypothetical protein